MTVTVTPAESETDSESELPRAISPVAAHHTPRVRSKMYIYLKTIWNRSHCRRALCQNPSRFLKRGFEAFQVQDRGTQQAPILGLWGRNGVGSLSGDSSFGPSTTGLSATSLAAGEYGCYFKSFYFLSYFII
jgi:hypothetical protein